VEKPYCIELLGVTDGEQLEEQRIESAEDSRIGAYAESEREYGGEGEAGRFKELTERVAKVLKK